MKSDKGSLRLNNPEAELLTFLVHHVGRTFSADQINDEVWNGQESPEKAELYLFYLKNKLRQIHSSLNIDTENETYALKEVKV